jgi:hypothetical protein
MTSIGQSISICVDRLARERKFSGGVGVLASVTPAEGPVMNFGANCRVLSLGPWHPESQIRSQSLPGARSRLPWRMGLVAGPC